MRALVTRIREERCGEWCRGGGIWLGQQQRRGACEGTLLLLLRRHQLRKATPQHLRIQVRGNHVLLGAGQACPGHSVLQTPCVTHGVRDMNVWWLVWMRGMRLEVQCKIVTIGGNGTCSTRMRARASSSSSTSRRLCWARLSRHAEDATRSCTAASRMRVICCVKNKQFIAEAAGGCPG
jgi:hypothetical protein